MLVDLYKDASLTGEASRLNKQVETRGFKLDNKKVRYLKDRYNTDVYDSIIQLSQMNRNYSKVGKSACDNLYLLEALGLGDSCREYTIILDFSDRLDYILHRLCKCSTQNVRMMNDYDRISEAILNLRFDSLTDVSLEKFIGLDNRLDCFMRELFDNSVSSSLLEEDILGNFLNRFFYSILDELNSIKNYCTVALKECEKYKGSIVYRSKSFASTIATASVPVKEELTIVSEGYESCVIKTQCYEAVGFIEEEAFNEFSRRVAN